MQLLITVLTSCTLFCTIFKPSLVDMHCEVKQKPHSSLKVLLINSIYKIKMLQNIKIVHLFRYVEIVTENILVLCKQKNTQR